MEENPMMMDTIEDAERLAEWTEPNSQALNWPEFEAAVLGALSGPVPDECAADIPLMRYANGHPARPLLDALAEPDIPRAGRRWHTCDITGTRMQEPNTLWVQCGRSVVQVTMRNSARDNLTFLTTTDLVWR